MIRIVTAAVLTTWFVGGIMVINYFIADATVRLAASAIYGVASGATIMGPLYDVILGRPR